MFVQKNIKKYEDNFVSLLVKVTNFKKKKIVEKTYGLSTF